MGKQNVISANRTVFSHKRKWSNNLCYDMDESLKYGAKWTKPDIKGYIIMYDSIYKFPELEN